MVYNTTSVQSDVNILLRHSSVCNEWNSVEIFVSYTIIRFVDLHLHLRNEVKEKKELSEVPWKDVKVWSHFIILNVVKYINQK